MKVSVRHALGCSCEDARAGFFRAGTWESFLREGEVMKSEVDLEPDAGRVHVTWTSAIPDEAPGIAKRVIGQTIDLDLRIHVKHGEEWRLDLDGAGGRGTFRSQLRMETTAEGGCDVLLDGDFRLRGGPLNVAARFEGPAWEHVVRAILVEDLLPLLCP